MKLKKFKKVLLFSLLVSQSLYAGAIFSIDVRNDSTGDSFTHNTSDLEDLLDSVDQDSISREIDSYVDTHQITADLDFRGLPMQLKFAENSTSLNLNIESLNINETFNGADRAESLSLLEDWFKTQGNVEKVMKELARVSPIDPIAGNPNSLMATMAEGDFRNGFQKVASQQKGVSNKNFLLITPTYKSLDIDGTQSDNYTLPLAYSFNTSDNPNEMLTLSLPISYVKVEEAKSYSAGLGIAYSLPVTDSWVLTPATKYSLVGSKNLGTLAQMVSGSLTSSYKFDLGNKHAISMGNMVGYYSTVKFYEADYAFDPGIANTVFRNAIMYSLPTDNLYKNSSLDMFIIDTRYTGTELYIESYDEIGLSFGLTKNALNITSEEDNYEYDDELKIGVSYLTSSKADGFEVNFGYSF